MSEMMPIQSAEIKDFVVALSALQAELDPVIKDAKNPHFKSNYAKIEAVIEALQKPFFKHGFAYTQTLWWSDQIPFVITDLMHKSGQWKRSYYPVLVAESGNPQKFAAGTTYARRISLKAMVGLPEEDDDGNTATHREPPRPQHRYEQTNPPRIDEGIFEEEDTRAVNDPNDPGTFVFNLPKFKGKRLMDIPRKDLINYLNYMNSPKAGAISPDGKKLLEAAAKYLGSRTEI